MGRSEIAGGGDRLARGAKSATFHVPANYPDGIEMLTIVSEPLPEPKEKELVVTEHRINYDLPIDPEPEPVAAWAK